MALAAIALLILANGMFVASEFALVSVSNAALEERAQSGDRKAKRAFKQAGELSFLLSAAQFGITVTSLLVGSLAEDSVGRLIVDPLLGRFGVSSESAVVSVILVFTLSTLVQMVVGELAPKTVALADPMNVSRWLAAPMHVFLVVFGPIIRLFDGAAAWLTRRLGVEVVGHGGGLSRGELRRVVLASGEEGALSKMQADLLQRGLELGEARLTEVMVARPDVDALHRDGTGSDLIAATRESGHSRFVLRGDDLDDVLGTVHVKDLLNVPAEQRDTTPLVDLVTPALIVPESEPLRRLLRQMRSKGRTFAVAVDEYGGVAGIATVEDVVERLVGGIEDEFDAGSVQARKLADGSWVVPGSLRTRRLQELLGGIEFPDGDFETVAGLVLEELGRIPDVGELVDIAGHRFEVTGLDGVRVTRIIVRVLPEVTA